ncbi:6278_t:CDS:1 [Racocetra fulgida]|uniref:6278_t:CDS:1 n=1 Tax=Racocetra fulgida TaxID=60492 RepID=A0A9N9B290_9GLOM|nr:6278_t:CDS:1 [Racocetra fulgida]
MSLSYQQQRRRGPYASKACNNCRQKHVKCSGKAPCKHCTLRNLECVFTNLDRKRGPKTDFTLPSVIPNVQDHESSTPQQHNYIGYINFISYDISNIHQINGSQESLPLTQTHIGNNNVMQHGHLISDLNQNSTSFDIYSHDQVSISSNMDYLNSEKFYN